MEIVFEHNRFAPPKVSVILLDWSCRESFHIFHYLNKQTVPREQYEVIWIEYYGRRSAEIEAGLKECAVSGKPTILDKWIVMDMPDNVYYHKHLMYNIGIITSQGRIVTFCDSDAIVRPTFVESIIKSFEKNSNIVLHLDEVRNNGKRFYPFNYPPIEEIIGEGAINWKNGRTSGLVDKLDPLHTRNYGACMCALREDLIATGGADEHLDYLGHICGPYEMTFRLVNAGKKEIWHQEEFLYHVWHPGQAGDKNYLGPHDGKHMSTTALEARGTGRIMPHVENPAIKMLRPGQDEVIYSSLLSQAIPEEAIKDWSVDKLGQAKKSLWKLGYFLRHPVGNLLIFKILVKIFIRQFYIKAVKFARDKKTLKEKWKTIYRVYPSQKNMVQYNLYVIERCRHCLNDLAAQGIGDVVVYGDGDVAEVLDIIAREVAVKISVPYNGSERKRFLRLNALPVEALNGYSGKVIIASLVGVEEKVETLKKMGIEDERIVTLQ